MNKGAKIAIAAVVALIVLVVGGWVIYAKVINDPEDKLTTEDLSDRLNTTDAPVVTADTVTPDTATSDSVSPDTVAPDTVAPGTAAPDTGDDSVDGAWTIAAGSEVGYRVKEKLGGVDTEGVGRTSTLTGSLTIEGTQATAGEFTVEVATITSDSDRRDSQFTGRIMETDTFPTATFVLTEPIDFGSIPAAGEQITATATGDLTLHGVTKSVTFEVTAQLDNGKIGVLGNIPVLFADYDIDNPSFGPVETEDNGLLEILLIFEQAS